MKKSIFLLCKAACSLASRSSNKLITGSNSGSGSIAYLVPSSVQQQHYMDALLNRQIPMVVGYGPAGCGKTLLACDAFVREYKRDAYTRLILTRPCIPVEGENLGFLPGTLQNKMAPWTQPVFDLLLNYFSKGELQNLIQKQIVDVVPLAFMRGRTFPRAFILGDEMQNSTPLQWSTLVTRSGLESKLVLTGDLKQSDLPRNQMSGLQDFLARQNKKPFSHCCTVELDSESVFRSPLVRDYTIWNKETDGHKA